MGLANFKVHGYYLFQLVVIPQLLGALLRKPPWHLGA